MTTEVIAINLAPGQVPLGELRSIYNHHTPFNLEQSAWQNINISSRAVVDIIKKGDAAYGINTGFGLLAQTRIADDQLTLLQRNLVVSHCTGVGKLVGRPIVRLIIALKIISLSHGYSGVRPEVVQLLIDIYHHDIMPCIPSKGSVGASGDLAPLAHLAATLIGVGNVHYKGQLMKAETAFDKCSLTAVELGPKEGLALLNGTQTSTALALAGLFETENVFSAALVTGALSVDAMKGSTVPFDARIQNLRGQPGQKAVSKKYRNLLQGSDILQSHVNCGKVQDPYSLRCQPQVMGACLDIINNVAKTLQIEANAVTDNPLVFADSLETLSGGNFHAEPVAFAADNLALAIAEIGSISERRISLLVDPHMNGGLPAFLVENSGLNSGFMIAQVTAAALVSENKTLAHPASVDSIPTSANQEDHVSMATFASRRLCDMTENTDYVVAIELLSAAQAVEFHHPHVTSIALQAVVKQTRQRALRYNEDRFFAPDIAMIRELITQGYFYNLVADILPSGLN
ncbi:MAG: histidine ammonia-lyase [Porticoccaceae bacterium]|nr:histidine ammonia-lyase [Porticoccaceae bacterium]MDG2115719.1 histidine ammonia-lyase [Porticoccaceae bacterium]|tara:strand:- start:100 stop:1647 length:1548 start_codon:yes stop_codon:yes gene_type:complete